MNLNTINFEDIQKTEKKFKDKGIKSDKLGHKIIRGDKSSKIMISSPHSVSQIRNGKTKKRELYLGTISLYLQKMTNCHLIYKTANLNDDANLDKNSQYKKDLEKYIKENNIALLIDLHGSESRLMDVEIGTYYGHNTSNKEIIKKLYNNLIDNNITSIRCDKINYAGKGTLAYEIKKNTGIETIQIEIGKQFRWPKTRLNSFKSIIKALESFIKDFDPVQNKKDESKNFYLEYDKLLDIKPSFGYKRNLGIIPKEYVGMELEIGINYQREKYTFIKKMLNKIKLIVGEKGYFVHDFTVISDYSFEIVLDPMPVDELEKVFANIKEVIAHSSNHLYSSKKYDCGIHLNFNKKDVIDLNKAHRKILNLMFNEKKYFNYNLYKKSKFITSYDEYLNFQKIAGSKYVAINYSKKKIIEVRNISANINHIELKEICEKFLNILYNIEVTKDDEKYIDFINIYEKSLKKLKVNQVQEIQKLNYLLIENINDKPTINTIKKKKGKNYDKKN